MEFQGYTFDGKYEPKNFEETVRENFHFRLLFFAKNERNLVCYCPTERNRFEIELKSNQTVKEMRCPNERYCTRSGCEFKNYIYEYKDLEKTRDVAYFQKTDKGVVLRAFRCRFNFSGEPYEELCRDGVMSKDEYLRVFYNYDRTYEIYSKLKLSYNPHIGSVPCISYDWAKKKQYQDYCAFEYLTDINEDFKDTFLQGYLKYIKLYSKIYLPALSHYDNESLGTHYYTAVLLVGLFKSPVIKTLMQHNFDRLVYDYVDSLTDKRKYGHIVNYKAKNLIGALKFDISKLSEIDIEDRIKLSHIDILNCQRLVKHGIKITEERLLLVRRNNFWEIFKILPINKISEVIKYLIKQKDNGMFPSDYHDYLNECKKLNYNLNNYSNMFPKNLRTAHRTSSELLRNLMNTEKDAFFSNSASKFAKYRFRQGNISLHVIDSVKDLKRWSQKFNNCSAGYVDRIIDGLCVIFIIVNVKDKRQPYFMLEYNVKSKTIAQCRGKNNTSATEDVQAFTNKWLKYIKSKKTSKEKVKAS